MYIFSYVFIFRYIGVVKKSSHTAIFAKDHRQDFLQRLLWEIAIKIAILTIE